MTKVCEVLALPGYGAHQAKLYHYSQAVRIGDRIETSGQGGWTPGTYEYPPERSLRDEYLQAFENVTWVLKEAGVGWDDVVHINSYHVGMDAEVLGYMVEQFKARMPQRPPIWTCVGVTGLGAGPFMRVEIRVTAIAE